MSRHSDATVEPSSRSTVEAAEHAWLLAVPCALVTIGAIALLGPPLGDWLFAPRGTAFLPQVTPQPEPTEHARYALAVLGAFALPGLVAVHGVRPRSWPRRHTRALVAAAQAFVMAWLLLALAGQEGAFPRNSLHANRIFTPRTLAVAALLTTVALVLLRRRAVTATLTRVRRETRARAVACGLLAAALTALWLTTGINSDASIGDALGTNLIPWDMDETFAVLNGRTPFVDFHAQYANLWPYVAAAVLTVAGSTSLALWTTTMATISGLALLAVYAVFRRVVRSSLLALGLFLPFLATTFFDAYEQGGHRFSGPGIFSSWPLRYAGPFLLAWLLARHLDGVAPRHAWLVTTAAGLVLLNNAEFGIAAFAAVLVALACARSVRGPRAITALARNGVAGLIVAGAVVVLLSMLHGGRLPDFRLLLEFPRIFAVDGWILEPMPTLGLHIAFYITFATALTAAAVRAARADGEPVLTGMLAWSGAFGLLAGSFYVGRSDPLQLILLLSAWCFALVLLLVLVVRSLAARGWRGPVLPELFAVFGFALAVCSIPQVPTPWSQVARLREHAPSPFVQPAALDLIARTTHRGEHVALLVPLGHELAHRLGLVNVGLYSGAEAMPTVRQVDDTIALVLRLHVHRIYVGIFDGTGGDTVPGIVDAFTRAGFPVRAVAGEVSLLSDRPLHWRGQR